MRWHLLVSPLRKSHTKGVMALLFAKEGDDLPRTKALNADDVQQSQNVMISAAILLDLKPVATETPSSCSGVLIPNYQCSYWRELSRLHCQGFDISNKRAQRM